MTVKDLIAKLSREGPDKEVIMCFDGDERDFDNVEANGDCVCLW